VPVDIGLYSKMPSKFFGSGMASILGPSASLLFLALCEHSNRNSSNIFKASDEALASDTRLAPRTICDARKRLIEYGLISCSREPGQSHKYTIVKQKFEWKPLKQRVRRKLKPRALHAVRTAEV
jgi:Helix-turn-helix domain